MGAGIGVVIVVLGFSVFVGIVAIVSGAVLALVWDWSIVPMFGLPSLTLTEASWLALLLLALGWYGKRRR